MTKEEFVSIFGGMYEHTPWAAARAWHEDLSASKNIITAMKTAVDAASEDEQEALIKAHPDLAGKLALSGDLTQSSSAEQAGVGLDQCSPIELGKFQRYNDAYKARFGFPFIIAVKGLTRADILRHFEQRLDSSPEGERKTALEQIHKIARLRIEGYFSKEDAGTPDFTELTNLAAPRLGSKVIFASDDFFADKARLIDPNDPIFIDDKYDDNGKWMDGWESRRKRVKGHDWAVIKLGRSGRISGFEVNTAHFTGNFPPFASIEVARSNADIPNDDEWTELVSKTKLTGDNQHFYAVDDNEVWTHIRLHIYPDGGIARLRVYGQIFMDWDKWDADQELDLAALEYGGRALYANDTHFGVPENLIAPGKGINMGDGWETRRNLARATDPDYWTKAHDFTILALAHMGTIERVLIDTAYFKGNYPDRVSIQAANITGKSDADIIAASGKWAELLSTQKLEMDREEVFADALNDMGPITHIRLNIFPDGGVSRLRLFGKITR